MYTSKIDGQIDIVNRVICRHLDNLNGNSRGIISQDILAQLRNFTEYVMLKCYAESEKKDLDITWENLRLGIEYVEAHGNLNMLRRFHDFLQMVASHYTLEEENSERLMLKYYEYLLKIKKNLKEAYKLNVLENLHNFPINTDQTLQEYYDRIAEKVDGRRTGMDSHATRYYIQKIKPFFSKDSIYYEVTFTPANDYANKFDRIIAFTDLEITENYSVKLSFENDSIQVIGKKMQILIITAWEVSIRDCEYSNFSKVINGNATKIPYAEKASLEGYLTRTGFNLVDLVSCSDKQFEDIRFIVTTQKTKTIVFFNVLKKCRDIILANAPGANILRYLLFHMNNKIIKSQTSNIANSALSCLYLVNGCRPFENMPFIYSPKEHNPQIGDLLACIPVAGREHELLARFVKNNTEIRGQLFTSLSDIKGFEDIPTLAQKYNDKLWIGHFDEKKLVIENGQIYINGYKNDTCFIIEKIKEMSVTGVKNYSCSIMPWLRDAINGVDCIEKKEALHHMFDDSRVALIYGSAGTGKTTLINHIARFFATSSKLFLAYTNPAVDNLKRRVTASNSNFMTITKFINRSDVETECDILFIDECSTVSNQDMRKLLNKAEYKLLVLVGDTYQISSIRFGNWFSIAKAFVPKTSITELTEPYRGRENEGLQTLWKRVRNIGNPKFDGDAVLEVLMRQGYSVRLDTSVFDKTSADEIILCLNYDGLYGINNINRFLQESNPSPAVDWGIQKFKVNDPILFSDSKRLTPAIYNNMKGRIARIEILDLGSPMERIQFDIELDKVLNEIEVWNSEFELIENSAAGNSVIRFCVNKNKSTDDDDNNLSVVIPFQIAYAVSIHKSQGLEYNSVKIIITDEVDELITHNIFYTAITRAKEELKIYWTPEVEKKVLASILPINNGKDVGLLKKYLQKEFTEHK